MPKGTIVQKDKPTSQRKVDQVTRTAKIRQRLQTELRDKFKGAEYIKQIEQLAKDLGSLQRAVKVQRTKRLSAKDRKTVAEVNLTIDTYELEIKIIKERLALNFKRLKFILPELRSMEITDPDGKNPLDKLGSAMATLTKALSS